MSIALVSAGAVASNGGTGSVAPAFGQATASANLLIAWVSADGGAASGNFTCSDGTWTRAVQDTAQLNAQSAIFYKANCGAGETAPTFAYSNSATVQAALAEFSGASPTSPLDQVGGNHGTANITVTAGGVDSASGDLVISADSIRVSIAIGTTSSDAYNNGATPTTNRNNDASGTQTHYRFAWGLTTGNSVADTNLLSATGTRAVSSVLASFKAEVFTSLGSLLPSIKVEVDATTNPTATSRTWTDITSQIRQLGFTRSGRNQELNRSTAGSLTAVCGDAGGAVTGLGLRKRQWVRVRAQWLGVTYARWQGVLEVLPRKWPGQGADQLVEFRAADAFKVLGLTDLAGQTFASQRNDQRVSAILALANLVAGSIDTNTDTADAVTTPFADASMALDYLLQIEDSENGLLIAQPDGTIDFQGRHWRYTNAASPVATFGESGDTIRYLDDAEYDDDDTLIGNIAAVTPYGASTAVVVTNSASTAKYWPTRFDRQLLTSNTAIAQSAAEWLTNRYGDPLPRIPAIACELAAVARVDTALVAALLAAGNSSRFTWTRQASAPISVDVYAEQISEKIDVRGGSWEWRSQLSPALDSTAWILGSSQLGLTTSLSY